MDSKISFTVEDTTGDHCILDYGVGGKVKARKFRVEEKCVKDYFSSSLQFSHPCILTAYGIEAGNCILYEDFVEYLFNVEPDNDAFSVLTCSEELVGWIKGVLQAIKYLHERGYVHGGLLDRSNYVVKENNLCLISIGCKEATSDAMFDDLKALLDTLDEYFTTLDKSSYTFSVKELQHFLNPFKDNTFTREVDSCHLINKLMEHPVHLLYPNQRMEFAHERSLAIQQRRVMRSVNWHAEVFDGFRQWDARVQGNTVLEPLYSESCRGLSSQGYAAYDGSDVKDLLRFMSNVYKHDAKEGSFWSICEAFDKEFEGFLAYVHQHVDLASAEDLR